MTPADEVRALELSLLNESVRKDAARVRSLLTDDFQEFGASGRMYSKMEIIAALQEEEERQVVMQDFDSVVIDSGTMLVRYRSVRTLGNGVTKEALRSSLWVRRDERWQMLFHQGTPADTRSGTA